MRPTEREIRSFVHAKFLLRGDRIHVSNSVTTVKDVRQEGDNTLVIVGETEQQRMMLRYPQWHDVELST